MVFSSGKNNVILLHMRIPKTFGSEKFIWDYIPFGWKIFRGIENTRQYCIDTYQKLTKGFANSETWSLDYSTSKWILPRLKHLRNNVHGVPPNLEIPRNETDTMEDRYSFTLDEWKERLDKIIYAFEFVLTEDDILDKCYPPDFDFGFNVDKDNGTVRWKDDRKPDFAYHEECYKKYEEGMNLFRLYFRHLWD
jgi:hypothetical protein